MEAVATVQSSSFFAPSRVTAAAPRLPRIAVIDDDPLFGKIMEQLGRKLGVEIKHFEDFETLAGYDVAIVDYDLGSMTGLDIGRHVERYIGSLPIILVSRTKLSKDPSWPRCIKKFVYKGLGAYAILDAAVEAHGLSTIDRNIKKMRGCLNVKTRLN